MQLFKFESCLFDTDRACQDFLDLIKFELDCHQHELIFGNFYKFDVIKVLSSLSVESALVFSFGMLSNNFLHEPLTPSEVADDGED